MKSLRSIAIGLGVLMASSSTPQYDNTHSHELPVLGDATSAILSPFQETQIGKVVLMQLRATLPIVNDPLIKYFTRRHCLAIALHSDLTSVEIHPVIINSKNLNAFAAPGGVLGINLGLFLHAQDVHEYSSVIAHELAHLSQRHYARRVEQNKGLTIKNVVGFMMSAAILAAGRTDAGLAGMLGTQSYVEGQLLAYSRTQEREADRVGLTTLTRAGYDPHGASRMFERMQSAFRFEQELPEYLSTHPITQSRIADMRAQADKSDRSIYVDSNDYQMVRTRAAQYFDEHPLKAVEEAHKSGDTYRLALAYSRANQHGEAVLQMKRLYDQDPNSILLVGSYAEILIRAGESQLAVDLLDGNLELYPGNAPLTMYLAHALMDLDQGERALKLLWEQTKSRADDQDVWLLLVEAAGAANKIIDVHRARAEILVLRGRHPAAIKQLHIARNLIEDNSRLHASLDQRILDIRQEAERLEG